MKNPYDDAFREGDPPYYANGDRDKNKRLDSEKARFEIERRKRQRQRFYATFMAVGYGLMLIFMFDECLIGSVPTPWIGWFFIGVGILGIMGVNVYSGGPLDYRLDDDPHQTD